MGSSRILCFSVWNFNLLKILVIHYLIVFTFPPQHDNSLRDICGSRLLFFEFAGDLWIATEIK